MCCGVVSFGEAPADVSSATDAAAIETFEETLLGDTCLRERETGDGQSTVNDDYLCLSVSLDH